MRPSRALLSRVGRQVAAISLLLWAAAACLSTSKYVIDDDAHGGLAGAGPLDNEVVLKVDPRELERLVNAFDAHDEECRAAFKNNCGKDALPRCAASPGCVSFAECVRERANPAAETTCSDDLGTSVDDSWAFEFARHCWAERYAECNIGRNFACVGDYGPPSAERTDVIVSQQVLGLQAPEEGASELSVAFCPGPVDCSEPIAVATPRPSDRTYTVSLAVTGKNDGIGNVWNGYRLVAGADIYPSIVDSSLPLWGRRTEITRILERNVIDLLARTSTGDARDAAFVQVVDCQSDPAPGIFVDVPGATVGYVDSGLQAVDPPTRATGAVGISGYTPDEIHKIVATIEGPEGRTVARYSRFLQRGRHHYLRLYPLMAGH